MTAGPLCFQCVPHHMAIQGVSGCWEARRDTHLHKAEVFALLLSDRRGRVRGRQRDMEKVITFCLKSAGASQSECCCRHQFSCQVSRLPLYDLLQADNKYIC